MDIMKRKSPSLRNEVTGTDDNTNKFVDQEEHEFSCDNDLIREVDTFSGTDQQEYLIDI